MAKKVKYTAEQIKSSINHDIQLYREAGLTEEDYVYDMQHVRENARGDMQSGMAYAGIGAALLLVGAGEVLRARKKYKKDIKSMEANVNYRIQHRDENK